MLRKIRIGAAIVCFTLITLLFLDFTGTIHQWFGWLAKIQFWPAVLALHVGVIVGLVLLTFVLGRVYCSVICPLGVFQDIVSWIAGKRKKRRFVYSPALHWLRYGVLAVFVIAFIAGLGSLVALISPYSAYGRIASGLLAPVYQWGNNLLAMWAERMDSYAFYSVDVWVKGVATWGISVLTFVVIVVLAWRNGRTYCNTICPVGTVLGFISRFSFLKPVIHTDTCNGCGLCARNCKASCIDPKAHQIDYSRCVTCMDCLESCRQGAITYIPAYRAGKKKGVSVADKDETNLSRRRALSATVLVALATALKAQQKKTEEVILKKDGGLEPIKERKEPARLTPIVPPGAAGVRHLARHCTGCQLCVSVCSSHVLRPSAGLMTLMQPEVSFDRGYCRPECVKCSEVCPTGAIRLITKEDKTAIQVGHAVWIKDNCIVQVDGVKCDNCARHCPTRAIQMVAVDPNLDDSLKIPVVNAEICIGCGACENLCPARPYTAMYVEGHEMHRMI